MTHKTRAMLHLVLFCIFGLMLGLGVWMSFEYDWAQSETVLYYVLAIFGTVVNGIIMGYSFGMFVKYERIEMLPIFVKSTNY